MLSCISCSNNVDTFISTTSHSQILHIENDNKFKLLTIEDDKTEPVLIERLEKKGNSSTELLTILMICAEPF